MNAIDAIARQARAFPDRPALVSRGRAFTFRQLWATAGAVAYHLKEQGVKQGDGVALLRVPNEAHLLGMIALSRLGAVSTTLPAKLPASELRAIVARHKIAWIMHGAGDVPAIDGAKPIADETVCR